MEKHSWTKVIKLVSNIFALKTLPQRLTHSTLVLIPKGKGPECRGIGLVESLWKIVGKIMTHRMGALDLQPSVHGFRPRKGTGTVTLEVKLLHTLVHQKGETVYQVFVDLQKSYDSVSRERLVEIMKAYGIGPRLRQLQQEYWRMQKLH